VALALLLAWRSSVVAGENLGDSGAGWSLNHYFGSLGDGADSGD
jgi:hypothetical protein